MLKKMEIRGKKGIQSLQVWRKVIRYIIANIIVAYIAALIPTQCQIYKTTTRTFVFINSKQAHKFFKDVKLVSWYPKLPPDIPRLDMSLSIRKASKTSQYSYNVLKSD